MNKSLKMATKFTKKLPLSEQLELRNKWICFLW